MQIVFLLQLPQIRTGAPHRVFTLALLLCLALFTACRSGDRPEQAAGGNGDVPEGMVYIPGGGFTMGGRSDEAYEDEFPRHEVEVSPFYMDATEVTNLQWERFVVATGYQTIAARDIDWEEMKKQLHPGTPKPADSVLLAGSLVFRETDTAVDLQDPGQWWQWTTGANWRHPQGPGSFIVKDHPVVHIAWEDAKAYAEWAGKRLPTEAEWEWAAMGGQQDAKYPWGNEPVESAWRKANFWQGNFPYDNLVTDGHEGTAPVKTYEPNGYGLYDMAGNVWEWCQDRYDVRAYQQYASEGTVSDPEGSAAYYDPREPKAPKHVIRGGSFLCNTDYSSGYRTARRMSSSRDSGFSHTGFRCVRDVGEG
ncbi:MAG: formylglycine-generating enzyme family protein [Cyclobacteriaceae bacterium]